MMRFVFGRVYDVMCDIADIRLHILVNFAYKSALLTSQYACLW